MIQTHNLTLRQPVAADWDAFHTFYQSDRSIPLAGPEVTLGQSWRTFATELGHWTIRGFGMFAVCQKGSNDAIGLVGPWEPEDWPEREIGWMMFEHEGKGFAYEAASAAIGYAFDTLKWDTATSYIAKDNIRSIRLAERLGAELDPTAQTPEHKPCLVYRHQKGALK